MQALSANKRYILSLPNEKSQELLKTTDKKKLSQYHGQDASKSMVLLKFNMTHTV